MESFSPIRCAIYTRKSTDEGLEKEFNTLEAQREAGENYIRSMKHQGWVILPEHYDDGGFSGGSLKRPALKQLLSDVEAGKVDMIVVYKIDRLTRSLLDFAQLVKIFEKHCCSFVSVTQHFNTCDSMGKLTLNILLSFAQFERELGAERVRDKIAASKKKGMWTGGPLPLGYDSKNKKLVINKEEAEIVRFIFEDYKRTGSQFQTVRDVNEKGYKPKERMTKTGKNISKGSFNHAMISNILNNPVYLGKVVYKGELYDGQHKAIISQELWDEVKSLRKANLGEAFRPSRVIKHSLLKGLIECEYCGAMTPTRSKHGNKYYEYPTMFYHDWDDVDARNEVLTALFDKIGLKFQLKEKNKKYLEHNRIMTIELENGEKINLILDQGFSYWRCLAYCYAENIFPFDADIDEQVAKIGQWLPNVSGDTYPTRIFYTKSK